MENIIKKHRFLASFLSIIVSVFLVAIFTYAATTIGTSITTGGTLSVTGAASFESASTTNDFWLGNVIADDDDYLYMDASSSEYMMWDDGNDRFAFSNDLKVPGVTTSTLAFWAGTGGTVDNLDMTGGDLYVQNDVEIDGSLWFDSGTTTDSFYVGGYASSTGGFYSMGALEIGGDGLIGGNITAGNYVTSTASLNTQGTLHVGGAATIDGSLTVTSATSSNFFAVGSPTPISIDYNGDLMVEDDVEIGGWASTTEALNTQGTLHVGGNATVDGEITSTGSSTASVMIMTSVKLTPSATPTPNVIGECFIDNTDYQLNCWNGAWQYVW
ncbi:hypothetical protein L6274_01845 [Candidatus Parcubacteria bacterium]|nr:hypothetical protein [Candidatus Parcubacteria bacterium]MCG2809196.1 hypothetical protein [Candidatus Portnoybacteria bacterium]